MKRRRFIFFAVTQIYYIGWLLLDFAAHFSGDKEKRFARLELWALCIPVCHLFPLVFRCDPFYKDRGQYIGNPL